MSEQHPEHHQEDESPVGDVRRIREKLSEEFGNDVRRLGEYLRQVEKDTARELGCEVIRKTSEPQNSSRD